MTSSALMAAHIRVPGSVSGGIIDRELEKEYESTPLDPHKEPPSIDIEFPEEELSISETETVDIDKIQVRGNQLISDQKINKVVKRYERRSLSMKEITLLCREIQKLYLDKGYFLIRVFPPVQTITDGHLLIEVLEVTVGAIQIEGNKHYKDTFIQKYLGRFQGKCPKYNDLIRQVMLLNDYSDLNVGVVFHRGQVPGTTDMIVKVHDTLPVHWYTDYNNYGPGSISSHRAGTKVEVGNALLQGDELTLVGVMGFPYKSLQFIDGIYTLPLNANGTSMELAALHSNYRVKHLQPLDMHGETIDFTVGLSQAMQRTTTLNSTLFAAFDYLDVRSFSKNLVNGQRLSPTDDFLRTLTLGGKFDNLDGWKGRNFASLELVVGIPSFLDGLKAKDSDCSRHGAGGRFGYLNGTYQRLQPMPWHWMLFLNFQGQAAFCKLPVSEDFYIGGISTVRGFPMAAAVGDSGLCLNIEGRIPVLKKTKLPWSKKKTWGDLLQLVTFIDHGEVYVLGEKGIIEGAKTTPQNAQQVIYQPDSVFMTSVGVGARLFLPLGIDVNVDWGFPLSDRNKTSDSIFYLKISKKIL